MTNPFRGKGNHVVVLLQASFWYASIFEVSIVQRFSFLSMQYSNSVMYLFMSDGFIDFK